MEAELKFVREKRHGIAVVGSCLFDAAARLGVIIESECDRAGKCDSCAVRVVDGVDHLSKPTPAEREHLTAARRKDGERLSCQVKITNSGEISIMTNEKKKDEKTPEEQRSEDYKKEFAALPLETKIERLLELEAIAFGDTVSYVLNAPYTIGGKIVDFLAHYGLKIEKDEKRAKEPVEEEAREAKHEPGSTKAEPKPKVKREAKKPSSE